MHELMNAPVVMDRVRDKYLCLRDPPSFPVHRPCGTAQCTIVHLEFIDHPDPCLEQVPDSVNWVRALKWHDTNEIPIDKKGGVACLPDRSYMLPARLPPINIKMADDRKQKLSSVHFRIIGFENNQKWDVGHGVNSMQDYYHREKIKKRQNKF